MLINTNLMNLQSMSAGKNTLLCVGLDSAVEKLPERFSRLENPQFEFNKWIIDQTHEFVCAYKPNLAFYEARGEQGWKELRLTMEYLHEHHSDIFTIADAKRGDIGSTNQAYAKAVFDVLGFDAITLHPYTGSEGLQPFLEREDKVSIILCKTSNPGSGEFQDQTVKFEAPNSKSEREIKLWEAVAYQVANNWNKHNNCMLVVGATYPEQIKAVRQIVGEMHLLIPGIGSQGGDLEAVVKNGLNSQGTGLIINSSRDIIFSENPGESAKELRDQINMNR